jgi:hypothetical protein
MVKINAQLKIGKVLEVEQLLKEFKDVFAWTYKDLKGIPPELHYYILCLFAKGQKKNLKGLRRKNNLPYL